MRIVAEGICKSFSNQVLHEVDLAIPAGSIHGLVGENGAGKSTLAKIIAGLMQADAGTLHLDDAPYSPPSAAEALRAGVAICTQELSLVDDLSVSDNILLATSTVKLARIDRRAADARASTLLDLVGLRDVAPRTRVRSLSLAEKQLVEIAKVLATDAKLLILDEPTSALTGPQADRLHAILRDRAIAGACVIYISHRLSDVLDICDEVTVLRDGRVRLALPSERLDEKTLIREMAGADADFNARRRTSKQLADARLTVENLRTAALSHPISFACKRGEILGIAGLAGAGRSELLRTVFGLDRRIGGSVRIDADGIATEVRTPRQAIRCGAGFVAEDRAGDGVFPAQALKFNITVAGLGRIADRAGRLVRSQERSAVLKLLKDLRVKSDGVDQKMRELSGGNQQKSLLARWLHCESRLLLLDEPTRGIDVAAKLAVHEELVRLRDAGMSIVAVSSEVEELQSLCDRILVLSKGKLVAEFQPGNWSQEAILAAAFSEYVQEPQGLKQAHGSA